MTYDEFRQILSADIHPWDFDHYCATFDQARTRQEFADYFIEKFPELDKIWFDGTSTSWCFSVPKNTVIPADFANSIVTVTDVPIKPTGASVPPEPLIEG
ncbi:hypothetical protein UFOVP961_134 [uncultured Caudovirales phage]|uniref:Uncharacterized protein n=1 Tax=uncultured Caudovirales phage TaxID=2100421 RepID=A0A6J5SQ16_9CAUD|nr:hypothetical protein UFOVP961_134 [uncultured Caudovirales phage]CAB4185386.1 hypothetical protein UFOVP1123_62 [uncultured Caudovirales phage]CAB4193476.1 hypothetical protein UFOVP1239_88 [uncultured Caudovirales phage]CAB4216046.1 hypothetical protein UFOVP1484_66 [uncultured Caudovirales phage]CAB5230716.1 hypothetical protein UFOVP1577_72 [uncultured Caudovirales phage]